MEELFPAVALTVVVEGEELLSDFTVKESFARLLQNMTVTSIILPVVFW